jgi:hypothetical protein
MIRMSARLPNSLHQSMQRLSNKEGISSNQFLITALAEKIAKDETVLYLKVRAASGSRDKLMSLLEQVPDRKPEKYDEL